MVNINLIAESNYTDGNILKPFKGATKPYFTHYSSVVIILLKRVYVCLRFLRILLEN